MPGRLDLNADVGELPEESGVDEALLAIITSANVACGGHAGDADSMLRICLLARDRGVVIGAQVSYVDRANFGRVRLDTDRRHLASQIREQIDALDSAATQAGTTLGYVKPHGALYHAALDDPETARAIIDAIDAHGRQLPVLTMPQGTLATLAVSAGLGAFAEAFVDRGYTGDGRLVSRDHARALLHEQHAVRDRIRRVIDAGEILSVDDSVVAVLPDSLCVHGDTPGAVTVARTVRTTLIDLGIEPTSFIDPRFRT